MAQSRPSVVNSYVISFSQQYVIKTKLQKKTFACSNLSCSILKINIIYKIFKFALLGKFTQTQSQTPIYLRMGRYLLMWYLSFSNMPSYDNGLNPQLPIVPNKHPTNYPVASRKTTLTPRRACFVAHSIFLFARQIGSDCIVCGGGGRGHLLPRLNYPLHPACTRLEKCYLHCVLVINIWDWMLLFPKQSSTLIGEYFNTIYFFASLLQKHIKEIEAW